MKNPKLYFDFRRIIEKGLYGVAMTDMHMSDLAEKVFYFLAENELTEIGGKWTLKSRWSENGNKIESWIVADGGKEYIFSVIPCETIEFYKSMVYRMAEVVL